MIKLSTSHKGYVIISNGKLIEAKGFKRLKNKVSILTNLSLGLSKVRSLCGKEDILTVEVSDSRVYSWLLNMSSSKDYSTEFYKMWSELNLLPCKVVFSLVKKDLTKVFDLEYGYVQVSDFSMD